MSLDLLRPSPLPSKGAGRPLSAVPLSIAFHLVVLLAVVVVPLLATGVLPQPPRDDVAWSVIPTEPIQPPPAPPQRRAARVPAAVNPDAAPLQPPAGVTPDDGLQREVIEEDPGLGPGVVEGPVDGGLPVAPVVADAPPAKPVGPLRPGGDIREPRKIVHVRPVYPELARLTHAEGLVVIEAVIAPDGAVRDARVLRSHPLLDAAALDAVRQWRYTPTLLNGVPVPVVVTVTVNFTLK